jgi:ankyrin repeat protein
MQKYILKLKLLKEFALGSCLLGGYLGAFTQMEASGKSIAAFEDCLIPLLKNTLDEQEEAKERGDFQKVESLSKKFEILSNLAHTNALYGKSYLVKIVVMDKNPEELKELLQEGANPNGGPKDNKSNRPLEFALASYVFRNPEIAQILVENGANVNPKPDEICSYTPLAWALWLTASEGWPIELVFKMLEHGADINPGFDLGPSSNLPDAIASMGQEEKNKIMLCAAKHGCSQTVALLIEKGADLNAKDKKGRTPLHAAAGKGHLKIAKLLIESDADVNATDEDGMTLLHAAAWKGHTEIVEFLIESGADVNAKDNDGWTPLHDAAEEGHLETVKLLIQHGADVNAKNGIGLTPLHAAEEEDYTEIVALLIAHGAEQEQ